MNAEDILFYGHRTLMSTLDGIPQEQWSTPGVCGYWSVKDIIAHLASYELVLVDVLGNLVDGRPTPNLKLFSDAQFNDLQVEQRQGNSPAQVQAEYEDAHQKVRELVAQVPIETRRRAGVLAWYGEAYDLEDFLVYSFYGHKREHSAQIAVFKDTLKG
jgi:uncharacterized protein (TIGR03083 family)